MKKRRSAEAGTGHTLNPDRTAITAKEKRKKFPWSTMWILAAFILSVVFVWTCCYDSLQNIPEAIPEVIFEGEYRIGKGEYAPVVPGDHIPSTKGDVTLRGTFYLCDPETGEKTAAVPRGVNLSFHLIHVGATVYAPGAAPYTFECEDERYREDACGEMILPYTFRSEAGDTVTVVIHNPHTFGNDNAVDHMLESFAIYGGINYESSQIERGDLQRAMGLVSLISGFLFLGVSAFSSLVHIESGRKMCFVGLMMLFAGGYFLLSVHAIYLWNSLVVFNTVVMGLCMMFYLIFLLAYIAHNLAPRMKKLGHVLVLILTAVTVAVVLVSFSNDIRFYDTYRYWFGAYLLLSPVIAVCMIRSFKDLESTDKGVVFLCLLGVLAADIDILHTTFGLWRGGIASRFVFVAIYLASFVVVLRIIPQGVNAEAREKQLEDEHQELKNKLQESRISIMLSQIKPHFLFNTLNSIYYLCEKDPSAAQSAINHFSDYLRNNLDNLQETELITFSAELEHVQTYLALEKVRFADELDVIYDITIDDFFLPVLTVQPLVENAVKHGISQKRGGGQVTVATRATETHYQITVTDTGKGFDPARYQEDGQVHIGIENVRERLRIRCGGTLTIESAEGQGTVATILLPKESSVKA